MRRLSIAIALVAAIAGSYGLGWYHSRSQKGGRGEGRVAYYVDPMHPAYKSDKPGVAPDCGMPLVAVYADDVGSAPALAAAAPKTPGWVQVDAASQQLLGVQVAAAERSVVNRVVRAAGRVQPEDTRVYRLNSGVDGYVRNTFQDSLGTSVKKDQTLATYYAPDFLAVASGFLAAVERVPGAVVPDGSRTMALPGALSKQGFSSLQGYTDRLLNLGMSELQIKRVADSKQLPDTVDIVAPVDGFILARNISAGEHFEHGRELYRIADLSRVWVLAELDEHEAAYLIPGAPATVAIREEGRRLPARVTDSLPQSETGGGTVKIRLEMDNPKFLLRPEMIVDVEVPVHMPLAITVPVDAVVDSGNQARVYVEHAHDTFEPRDVKTGWRFGERIQVVDGLRAGERVLASGTFLVDSESRLKPAPVSARPRKSPDKKMAMGAMRAATSMSAHHGHGDD
jgi:Cu(I)/Ag(I) efflux system membrane fusion protein